MSDKGEPFQSDSVSLILEPDMQNALISGCSNSILGVPIPWHNGCKYFSCCIKFKRIKW